MKSSLDAYSAGLSTDGSMLATIGYRFGTGWVSLTDLRTGQEHRLSRFDDAFGNEQACFSPDNRWLLIPRSSRGPVIIEVATGATLTIGELDRATCWWVHQGHLGLLSFGYGHERDPDCEPDAVVFNDLTTGDRRLATRIRPQMPLAFPDVWNAEPHADGRILLASNVPSTSPNYRAHMALTMLDLRSGTLSQVQSTYADPDHAVLRNQEKRSWNSPFQVPIATPPTVLANGFAPVDLSGWPADDEDSAFGAIVRVDFDSPFLTGQL